MLEGLDGLKAGVSFLSLFISMYLSKYDCHALDPIIIILATKTQHIFQ